MQVRSEQTNNRSHKGNRQQAIVRAIDYGARYMARGAEVEVIIVRLAPCTLAIMI